MIEVDNKSDLRSQLQKSRRVVALFYASWCSFCRKFLPIFNKQSSKQDDNLILRVKLNDYDNPLWADYSIEAVPTVVLFNEGKIWRRLDGRFGYGLSEQQLKEWLKEV